MWTTTYITGADSESQRVDSNMNQEKQSQFQYLGFVYFSLCDTDSDI